METRLSKRYRVIYHAHEHGPAWLLLNHTLHLIVFVYTLFGMIRFRVRFIRMVRLMGWMSTLIVGHSWMLTFKFALMALTTYILDSQLEARGISLNNEANCSIVSATARQLHSEGKSLSPQSIFTDWLASQAPPNGTSAGEPAKLELLAQLHDWLGGPFKLLGTRTILMYGFFAIALFIMLAVFPVELVYFAVKFNFVRFVLNDPMILHEILARRSKHLDRVNMWSLNKHSSLLTLSTNRVSNQRQLRCRRDSIEEMESSARLVAGPSSELAKLRRRQPASVAPDPSQAEQRRKRPPLVPVNSLRHSFARRHHEQPSLHVRIANQNLANFLPYVRSEGWFKTSMVVYTSFVCFYFVSLSLVIAGIYLFFMGTVSVLNTSCKRELEQIASRSEFDLFADWSLLDKLSFYETKYMIFALSCASSFYCSYYFGTILEHHIWISEISQQLNICKIALDLSSDANRSFDSPPLANCFLTLMCSVSCSTGSNGSAPEPPASGGSFDAQKLEGPRPEHNPLAEALVLFHENVHLGDIDLTFNEFGGFDSLWLHLKFLCAPQSTRFRWREVIAIKLFSKRQTLLRATYINMNLLLEELHETNFMTTTILRRTTELAFGFASMVGITKSQFEASYINLTFLLLATLAILNLYLACAASINSSMNRLLPQIHALICSFMTTKTDNDLLEFWVRHLKAYGTSRDAMSYKIYGYKITWSSIISFNGAVASAYLFTIY